MPKPTLPQRLEFAILQIVMNFKPAVHQATWGQWHNEVSARIPELGDPDELKAAFTRLSKHGYLQLSKWSNNTANFVTYSGDEQQQTFFFFNGDFRAAITDTGRAHWANIQHPTRDQLFISHITEEKPIALVLKKYIQLAFGDAVPVFVSSDGKSIGGGMKWYNHIIDGLRLSEVILVLVSQESKGREWINFEAGFGEGMESLVVPVGIKHMSLGQIPLPISGIQARSIDDLGLILHDIGNRLNTTASVVDLKAYSEEIEEAEANLIYKSLTVQPVRQNEYLFFDIQNVGNADLELLMLEVYFPADIAMPDVYYAGNLRRTIRNGTPYVSLSCYSNRGSCDGVIPVLRPVATPSMGTIRPAFNVRVKVLSEHENLSIFYQLHAVGYRTEEETCRLSDIPSGPL